MIDINKKYRTRDGREVKIFETDAPIPGRPVVGRVKYRAESWELRTWTLEGRATNDPTLSSPCDLIEVREPKRMWVNEYNSYINAFTSEDEAKRYFCHAIRIAVPYIEVIEETP